MAFVKALVPGFLLTWIVAGLIGSQRVRGGLLSVESIYFEGHHFYWSWPLFLAATGLAWAIFWLLDS